MPDNANPVIPESVSQVVYSNAGADVTVSMAFEAQQLQLNAFEPIIAHSLLQSVAWLESACRTLRVNCVDGIAANTDTLEDAFAHSITAIAALAAAIGYAQAAQLATQAPATDERISELVIARGLLEREQFDEILQPERLSGLSADHGVTNDADSAEAVPRDEITGEFEAVPEPKK